MAQYVMRLDDAAPHANWENWNRMEKLMDLYGIRPLVGVIPNCMDQKLNTYAERPDFWKQVRSWREKGWTIAMHGYDHVYLSENGGFNPVNHKSEFAGIPLEEQKQKIREGVRIFQEHGIEPEVFFAPSHTMDLNTIEALKQESRIRIISDTIASRPYNKWGMTFVPQQSGRVRKLPFGLVTFCYHPNVMGDKDFIHLEDALKVCGKFFVSFPLVMTDRHQTVYDRILRKIYFIGR